MLRTRQSTICRSYLDRVDHISTHNKIFFVFDLGRYNNKRIYHFGESPDFYLTEFQIHKSFPVCKPIIIEPATDPNMVQKILAVIPNKVSMPFVPDDFHGEPNFFTCDNIDLVIAKIQDLTKKEVS
jgi:hypothetical protein